MRFVKANDIELTKERTKCGLAYIISKQDIQKAFNLFKKSPKKPNYFSEMSLLEKAFLDVEIFLKQGNLK
ncbi:hypothetical protein [Campylobacter sp. US33a]|uniref:hypothetical protein n=1 Tax=Campylobacter sp. US33a TaxID=2498120 RepID=UPI00106844D3|nr:hypothetical protein [Campylobacter sp. US33a]TEY00704.1 hypothetical protein ELQ16_08705 [Campylobacter sp. US33a]